MEVLGCPPATTALPYFGNCPACHQDSLHIFHDTVNSTEWHYCSTCKQSGDMIELAQRVWRLDIPTTIHKLRNEFPELKSYHIHDLVIKKYEANVVNSQVRAKEFWSMASSRLISTIGLRQLRLVMEITPNLSEEEWTKTGGQFIGSADRKEIDDFVDWSTSFFSSKEIDTRHWKTMLVIPFWDAPEHISAFLFCHEESNQAVVPFKYYSVTPKSINSRHTTNAGIAMLPALFQSKSDRGFIFLDPVLAARMHVKHYAVNTSTLPLAAVLATSPTAPVVKEMSPSRELIYFDHKITPHLIRHAQAVNGKVVCDSTVQGIYKYSRKTTVAHWLEKLYNEAISWDVALETCLSEMPASEVEQWFITLGWPEAQLREFVAACTPSVKEKLSKILDSRFSFRTTDIDTTTIIASDSQWVKSGGEVITNAPFYIDRIIHYRAPQRILYQGHITYKSEDIPFLADRDDFEDKPFKWIDEYLIKQGRGCVDYSVTWQRHGMTLSKRFSTPTVIDGIDSYGWNSDDASFYFPDYLVKTGGEVIRHQLPCPSPSLPSATELSTPVELTVDEIVYLEQDIPEVNLLWSMFCCTVHNLLSKLYSTPTYSVFISNAFLTCVPSPVDIAKALGCWHSETIEPELEAQAVWPLFYEGQFHPKAYKKLRNCFVRCAYSSIPVCDNRISLTNSMQTNPKAETLRIARKMVPLYIKQLAEHRWRRLNHSALPIDSLFTPIASTTQDVISWFERMGGNGIAARFESGMLKVLS